MKEIEVESQVKKEGGKGRGEEGEEGVGERERGKEGGRKGGEKWD